MRVRTAMFNDVLLEHFRQPRNTGELAPPAVSVEVSNPACGDVLRLSAAFDGDRISSVRYQVKGCTASIATGSAMTEVLLGKSRTELTGLSAADFEAAIGGLSQETRHASVLCLDAVKAMLRKVGDKR